MTSVLMTFGYWAAVGRDITAIVAFVGAGWFGLRVFHRFAPTMTLRISTQWADDPNGLLVRFEIENKSGVRIEPRRCSVQFLSRRRHVMRLAVSLRENRGSGLRRSAAGLDALGGRRRPSPGSNPGATSSTRALQRDDELAECAKNAYVRVNIYGYAAVDTSDEGGQSVCNHRPHSNDHT